MSFCPSTAQIHSIFQSEILDAGGKLTDVFDDGQRLFARSVLPDQTDVCPGDNIRAGVALRAADDLVLVHPYTFRQVCSNGAIMARAVQTIPVERLPEGGGPWQIEEVCQQLREAVRACVQPEAFEAAASQMRTSMESDADMLISLLPHLLKLSDAVAHAVLNQIRHQFLATRDRSRYGLINAVTATARDAKDPELRWQLEELGGEIMARRRFSILEIPEFV